MLPDFRERCQTQLHIDIKNESENNNTSVFSISASKSDGMIFPVSNIKRKKKIKENNVIYSSD